MSDNSDTVSTNGEWEQVEGDYKRVIRLEGELNDATIALDECRRDLEEERHRSRKYKEEILRLCEEMVKMKENWEKMREEIILKSNEEDVEDVVEASNEEMCAEEATPKPLTDGEENEEDLENMGETSKIDLSDDTSKETDESTIAEEKFQSSEDPRDDQATCETKVNSNIAGREKKWMRMAISDMSISHKEIIETTVKLFKAVTAKDVEAKRCGNSKSMKKMMREVEKLEKESKDFAENMKRKNAKLVKIAKGITTKVERIAIVPVYRCNIELTNAKEITKEDIEFCDDLILDKAAAMKGKEQVEDYQRIGIMATNVKIEKNGVDNFYEETLTYVDGTATYRWRVDNVVRDGIRAVVENDKLHIYCASGARLRFYTRKPFFITTTV